MRNCPQCAAEFYYSKSTSSGREVHAYVCPNCYWREQIDEGVALWKVMAQEHQREGSSFWARIAQHIRKLRRAAPRASQPNVPDANNYPAPRTHIV